jgi:hypothetical protein
LAKSFFAKCHKKHLTKSFFAECFLLPRIFCVALGKELAECPKKYSAKYLALGKEPNFGSANVIIKYVTHAIILF